MMPKSAYVNMVPHGNAIHCDKRIGWTIKSPRAFEDFLTAHGFSRRAARSICSKGFRGAEEEKVVEDSPQANDDQEAVELLRALGERLDLDLDFRTKRR
jgi:hypothetical protein